MIVTSCGWLSRSPAPVMRTKRVSSSAPRSSARRSSPSPGAGRRRAGETIGASGPLYGTRPSMPSGTSLLDVLDVALEVAVLGERARLHRAERAHAAVLLEALALDEDRPRPGLVGAGEHRAEHHGVGAGGDRLGDVAGDVMPPSAITGMPCAARRLGDVVDRRDLRHADAGDDARGADRSGPDADLHGVGARIDQRLRRRRRSRCCRRSARRRTAALIRRDHLDHAARVAVRGVDDEHVDPRGDERRGALERVGPDADRRADAQAALLVLGRVRVLARASGCP